MRPTCCQYNVATPHDGITAGSAIRPLPARRGDRCLVLRPADARLSYGRSRPIDEVGQVVLQRSGLESEATSCVNTPVHVLSRTRHRRAGNNLRSRRAASRRGQQILARPFPVTLQVISRQYEAVRVWQRQVSRRRRATDAQRSALRMLQGARCRCPTLRWVTASGRALIPFVRAPAVARTRGGAGLPLAIGAASAGFANVVISGSHSRSPRPAGSRRPAARRGRAFCPDFYPGLACSTM